MELIEDAEGVRACVRGNLLVFSHYAAISMATARVVADVNRRVLRPSTRFRIVVVIEPNSAPPSSEARSELRRTMDEYADSIAAVGFVMPGHGFAAAALRGVITGLMLVMRAPFPMKCFASIRDSVTWLEATEPGLANIAGVIEDVETFARGR